MDGSTPLVQTLFRPDSWLSIRKTQIQHDVAKSRLPTAVSSDDKRAHTHLAWIGNSMVQYNNLPKMLASMLKQDGIVMRQDDVLIGGQGLCGHSLDKNVRDLLVNNKWEYVVLQDNSSVPGGADEKLYADTLIALSTFYAGRMPSVDAGKVLLFNTWAHRDGSCAARPQHRACYPTFLQMHKKTARGYQEYKATLDMAVSDDIQVLIVPVGEAFHRVWLAVQRAGQDPQDPESLFARLYAPDGYHPSRLGTFLAACVFYGAISGTSPKDLHFDVRGRTLAIEGYLVGNAFVDSPFDDFMKKKLGETKWSPERLTPEIVRPLQAFAHAALHPDEEEENIPLPPLIRDSNRPSTRKSSTAEEPCTS